MDYYNVLRTLHQTKNKDFLPVATYINSNNQMKYIICNNGIILPINPQGYNLNLKDTLPRVYSLDSRRFVEYNVYYNRLTSQPLLNKIYNIDSICVDNNKVVQVIVNKSYIPLKPMKHLKNAKYSHKTIYNNKNLYEIDTIMQKNTIVPTSTVLENIYKKDYTTEANNYNEYVKSLFVRLKDDPDVVNHINAIIEDRLKIYNGKILLIYNVLGKLDKSHNLGSGLPKTVHINDILYKLTFNIVNNGLDIGRLLNETIPDYTQIAKLIAQNEDALYFTLDNMQEVLDGTFGKNPHTIDNVTNKYTQIKKPTRIKMFRENIQYFNDLLSGNYHITGYRESNIRLLELVINPANNDVFRDDINKIYRKDTSLQSCTYNLRIFLLDNLLAKYSSKIHIIKSFLLPYNAQYNIQHKTGKICLIPDNIQILKDNIRRDVSNIGLVDLRILSLLYNLNIVIFTLQNENLLNILNKKHEHHNNPKINIRIISENKDRGAGKYLLVNHQFLSRGKNIMNNLSIIMINDMELIEYKYLPVKLKKELQI